MLSYVPRFNHLQWGNRIITLCSTEMYCDVGVLLYTFVHIQAGQTDDFVTFYVVSYCDRIKQLLAARGLLPRLILMPLCHAIHHCDSTRGIDAIWRRSYCKRAFNAPWIGSMEKAMEDSNMITNSKLSIENVIIWYRYLKGGPNSLNRLRNEQIGIFDMSLSMEDPCHVSKNYWR